MSKTQKAIRDARWRVVVASDRAAIARGELQWTNGYRCGAKTEGDKDQRLRDKEYAQQRRCHLAEETVKRAIAAYARAIRRSYDPIKRPAK